MCCLNRDLKVVREGDRKASGKRKIWTEGTSNAKGQWDSAWQDLMSDHINITRSFHAECLLRKARCFSKLLSYISPFHNHSNPVKWIFLLFFSFYRCLNEGRESINNFLKVRQVESICSMHASVHRGEKTQIES